jgi:hypothetical protein
LVGWYGPAATTAGLAEQRRVFVTVVGRLDIADLREHERRALKSPGYTPRRGAQHVRTHARAWLPPAAILGIALVLGLGGLLAAPLIQRAGPRLEGEVRSAFGRQGASPPDWVSPELDGAIYARPLVVGNQLLVPTEANSVYALDTGSGSVVWQQRLGDPVPGSALPCGNIDPVGLLFYKKSIVGFYLGGWLESRGAIGTLRAAGRIQRMIIDGKIGTTVQRRITLDEVADGLRQYVRNMTAGKVLILPHGFNSPELR